MSAALLLIDVVNPFSFEGAAALIEPATAAAERIGALAARARTAGVPCIYVNDNFGRWQAGFRELVSWVRETPQGRTVLERVMPDFTRDHFVLKPRHSGFFQTSLEALLEQLAARRLLVTGIAADICVLFTANDAYMRGFSVAVPADCVASERPEDTAHVLRHMARVLKADVRPSREIEFEVARAPAAGLG